MKPTAPSPPPLAERLQLPARFHDVTAGKSGQTIAVVGPVRAASTTEPAASNDQHR